MISRIINLYESIKDGFVKTISDIKGECTFNIPDVSTFTKEQKIAFDQMIDFLADMIEKYGDKIPKDDIEIRSKKTA
ncbi:MAG: hypothetical protein IKB88_01335 [Clostridia bacterium]|nr:hypothetical protein [Clostridia bacterium]MEE1064878.1 hypothetical protein [Acutalibacteraceae bacterium]